MGANELQQSFLDAIDLLSNKAANSTNAVVTIKAEIVEELDSGVHQYSIKYGGAIYEDAYSMANMTYLPSTMVYVLVPDGDFDNTKLILNAASPVASTFVVDEETDNKVPISDNLFPSSAQEQIDLKSWIDGDGTVINLKNTTFTDYFQQYTKKYRTFALSVEVKTEIDDLHQKAGDYGLKIAIPFSYEDASQESGINYTTKQFIINVDNMQGNPYAFNEYQKQILYFTIDDTLTFDASKDSTITPYVSGFGYSEIPDKDPDIHFRNLSLEMIDILPEEKISGYYLAVVSDRGTIFPKTEDALPKTLTPLLKINGKNTSLKNYQCYWFVEDASVGIDHKKYVPNYGGFGWRCLNQTTDMGTDEKGNPVFQYITDNYSYKVEQSQVISSLRFKCTLVKPAAQDKNSDIVVSGVIELQNLKSDIETYLYSKTGSNIYAENVGEVHLIARYKYPNIGDKTITYEWQRFNKDGQYIDKNFFDIVRYNEAVDDGYYETEISFSTDKIEKLNVINCTFYQNYVIKEGNTPVETKIEILGTESIAISTSPNISFTVSVLNGDKLYKYDSDGDSPMLAVYDGPRSSALETIDPLSFKVFKVDGSELTESEYRYCKYTWRLPVKSMMQYSGITEKDSSGRYFVTSSHKEIRYEIRNSYNKNYNDNTIYLEVTLNGETVITAVPMKFIKDGESGTNGSKYVAYITYKGYGYGERDDSDRIRKFQAVFNPTESVNNRWKIYNVEKDNTAQNRLESWGYNNNNVFSVKVFKDGSAIIDSSAHVSVTWSMFDNQYTDACFSINKNGVLSRAEKSNTWAANNNYCNIIQAEIKVGEQGMTMYEGKDKEGKTETIKSQEVIYAYYPIEIIRLQDIILTNNNSIIPTLIGGYEEVVYAADGTNPEYDKSNDFVCTDSIYRNNQNTLQYVWETSGNLTNKATDLPEKRKITPYTKFDNGLTKNYIKVTLRLNDAGITEIEQKIKDQQELVTKYTKEKENYEAILNLIQNEITGRGLVENYNNTLTNIEKIDNCRVLLDYRNKFLTSIVQLIEEADKMIALIQSSDYSAMDVKNMEILNLIKADLKKYYIGIYNSETSKVNEFYQTLDMHIIDVDFEDDTKGFHNKRRIAYAITWNDLIDKYNATMNDFRALSEDGSTQKVIDVEIPIYNTFKSNLQKTYEYFNEIAEKANEFKSIKNQLIPFCNKFNNIQLTAQGELPSVDSRPLVSYEGIKGVTDQITDLFGKSLSYKKTYTDKKDATQVKIDEANDKIYQYEIYVADRKNNPEMILIKPIVMLFNRYELSNINGWDGSKLYTGTNDDYLLAPQVGAGYKHNSLFTGMVMGIKNHTNDNKLIEQQIGMFGYGEGIQTMFLNAKDGSAIFGKSGVGQIIIDPRNIEDPVTTIKGSKALLYSSNYFDPNNDYDVDGKPKINVLESKLGKGKNGMLINLTDSYIHLGNSTSGKIYAGDNANWKAGNEGFHLSFNGLSIGSGFVVAAGGATEIINENSSIAGWRIRKHEITREDGTKITNLGFISNDETGIFMDSNSSTIALGSSSGRIYSGGHYDFGSSDKGFYLSDKGLSITGEYTVDGEQVKSKLAISTTGNPEIYTGNHNTLISRNSGFYIGDSGMSIHNFFRVSSNGIEVGKITGDPSIEETHRWWTIGSIDEEGNSFIGYNANKIAFYWDGDDPQAADKPNPIFTNDANATSVYLGTDGFRIGKKFGIDKNGRFCGVDGYLTGEIRANKGYIGNWEIKNGSIKGIGNSYIELQSDGDIMVKGLSEVYGAWKLKSDGTISVNSINSTFGGVEIRQGQVGNIQTKATFYNSQANEPFKGTCINHIQNLAKDVMPTQTQYYIDCYTSDGQGGWISQGRIQVPLSR